MRTILLATATILGMTAGTAMADRAPVKQQELAAVALTKAQIDPRDGTVARNGLPDVETNRGPQYAAGGGSHPDAETNAHGTQYAAGGGSHPDAETNEHGTQYAAGGGSHPDAETNEHGTQYAAAGGGRYPGADTNRG